MWCLETRAGRVFIVPTLPAVLGSQAGVEVVLRHETIAARHARFTAGPGGTLLVEAIGDAVLGVNRKRVRRARLSGGERLTLGRVAFTVVAPTREGREPPEPEAPRIPSTGARRPPLSVDEQILRTREKALQFQKVEQRGGLLRADLSQLPATTKALAFVGLLAIVAALAWGVAALFGLLP